MHSDRHPMGNRLYVGNLSYDTDNNSLRDAFAADGRSVTDVHVMTDRDSGQPRGFGFVEMADCASSSTAPSSTAGTSR